LTREQLCDSSFEKHSRETRIPKHSRHPESNFQTRGMQPHVVEQQAQQAITEAPRLSRSKQFTSRGFQQLSIFDTCRAHLLAGTATETSIDVAFEGRRVARQPAFADSAH
jgi:hypothetical protein